MIGRTVGHYRILDKLGDGGRSVVHNARGSKLRRMAGLNFLFEEMTPDQQALRRFER
ncbi:MAG TPA: hypothetical protein VEO19_07050 [Terriglobia bacterium]|nr:hypothetical protein [Terriglobia bacterium]